MILHPYVLLGLAIGGVALYGYGRFEQAQIDAGKYERARAQQALSQAQDVSRRLLWAKGVEKRYETQLAAASMEYQQELRRLSNDNEKLLADIAAGRRRLSVPIARGACLPVPAASQVAGKPDGEARAELSEQASRFLISEATRANKVVAQLTAVQTALLACESTFGLEDKR